MVSPEVFACLSSFLGCEFSWPFILFFLCLRVVAGLLALVGVQAGLFPQVACLIFWLDGPFRLGAVSCILWCILTCCHMLAVAVGLLVGAFAFSMLAWPHSLVRPSGVLLVPACLHFSYLCMVLRLYRISCTFPGLYRMSSLPVLSGLGSRLFVVAAGRLGVGVQPGALRGLPLLLMLAVLLFLPMLLVFSHFLAHLRFRPLFFSSRPFPVLCSLRGPLISGFYMRFFLGCFSMFLLCFCTWVFHVGSFSRGWFSLRALVGACPSGLCMSPMCSCLFCQEVSRACISVLGCCWTLLGVSPLSLSDAPFPTLHFVFCIGSCASAPGTLFLAML